MRLVGTRRRFQIGCDGSTFDIHDVLVVVLIIVSHMQRWPEAEFHLVADGGHSHSDPGIQAKLVEAADKYKHL